MPAYNLRLAACGVPDWKLGMGTIALGTHIFWLGELKTNLQILINLHLAYSLAHAALLRKVFRAGSAGSVIIGRTSVQVARAGVNRWPEELLISAEPSETIVVTVQIHYRRLSRVGPSVFKLKPVQ